VRKKNHTVSYWHFKFGRQLDSVWQAFCHVSQMATTS